MSPDTGPAFPQRTNAVVAPSVPKSTRQGALSPRVAVLHSALVSTAGDAASDNPRAAAEAQVLRDLDRSGADPEALRSLAIGAVVRGRLAPAEAAQCSPCTEAELSAFVPAPPARTEVFLSVVVPAFNEENTLSHLWQRLEPILREYEPAELVLVDDGSSDGTWASISALAEADGRVRGVRLSRNFGHQSALAAGMAAARGQIVVFMDADLQDPPELLHDFIARWRDGAQVVYGVRKNRKEGALLRLAFYTWYRVFRRLSDVDVPVDAGDFALLDRVVVDEMLRLPEHSPYLRGLRSWVGYNQVGLEYERAPRHSGRTKYSILRRVRFALDGVLSFSAVPLRLASFVGMLTALAGVVYIGVAFYARFVEGGLPRGWTSTIAILLTVGGAQLLVIGVLGEYVARVYDETKARPNFIVSETTAPAEDRAGGSRAV